MSEKNPFEIRAELLKQAQVILSENAHGKSVEGNPPGKWSAYTTEDVIAEAAKLYAFVSNR